MQKNKFFSPRLFVEGLKQTKIIGICLAVISILVSWIMPISRIMTADPEAGTIAIRLDEFAAPIFSVWYIIPAILIFSLFGFMNKRNASDFYHSAPLGRICVYITYTLVAITWCAALILVTTLGAFVLYAAAPYTVITSDFIWMTMSASFVLALLVMSIALVAKGLSGTFFSNAIILLLLMFVPRILISVFSASISAAVPIAQIESIPLIDMSTNIIFVPINLATQYNNYNTSFSSGITNSTTLWYSLILAVIYLVVGFFIHIARKSESAETSSAFKWVQHIARILIGILPTLVICFCIAARTALGGVQCLILISLSLLFYFLYELATTRSGKKMLIAIPLYLIVVAFNVVFVLGSRLVSNSILDNIPEASEVESVSIYTSTESYLWDKPPYYVLALNDCKYSDKELIEIFSNSLVSDVDALKAKGPNFYMSQNNYEVYNVTFHCKNGSHIQRNVFVIDDKYFKYDRENESYDSEIEQLLKKDKGYSDTITKLPNDNEIISVGISNKNNASIVGYENGTSPETEKIWKTFKEEYAGLSFDDKMDLNVSYNNGFVPYSNTGFENKYLNINVMGYRGTDPFDARYALSSKKTPKTLAKISEIYGNSIDSVDGKYVSEALSKIGTDDPISISLVNAMFDNESEFSISMDSAKGGVLSSLNKKYIEDIYKNGGFNDNSDMSENYEFKYCNIKSKDMPQIKRVAEILTNAAKRKCNLFDERTFVLELNESFEYNSTQRYFINLTADEHKEILDILDDIITENGDIYDDENAEYVYD